MTEPERKYFPIPPLGWVIIVVVLITGGYIWWSDQDHRPRAALGRIVSAEVFDGGEETTVVTPVGKVAVRFAEPVAELPAVAGARPSELRSPRKGSFIGVVVSAETPAPEAILRTDKAETVKLPELTLVADGHRYSLNDLLPSQVNSYGPMFGDAAGYVAVAGTPRTAQLEVGYDGERGLFGIRGGATEPGRFTSMQVQAYPTAESSCGQPTGTPAFAHEDLVRACHLGVVRAQYVAGLGWAAPDKEWVAVAVSTQAPFLSGYLQNHYVSYNPAGQRTASYRFDGDANPARLSGSPYPVLFTSVPKGSPATLTVVLRYAALKNLPDSVAPGPRNLTIAATWTIRT